MTNPKFAEQLKEYLVAEQKAMRSWVNEFSIVLVHATLYRAQDDGRAIRDELEKDIKKLGYINLAHHVKLNSVVRFDPGRKSTVAITQATAGSAKLDWEVNISVPTLKMLKDDTLRIAEITKSRIELVCKRRKYFLFKTIHSQLGYVEFSRCRRMLKADLLKEEGKRWAPKAERM